MSAAIPETTTILKLVNGDEIIGKVIEHETHFEVKKALQVFKMPDRDTGQMKIGMADYIPYAHTEIGIMRAGVVAVAIPQTELANQYAEATGEIILPNTQIITG